MKSVFKIRVITVALEVALIIILLIVWLSSESIRKSKSLWVLFFYCFPSHFLIALVPHEPVLIYFGKFHVPLKVTLIAAIGTLCTEMINYSVFKLVTDMKFFHKIRFSRFTKKLVELFKKRPFIVLIVAGFTPVPFYPFRFLVVLAHYPLIKYIIAVFLSRTPRYYLLTLIGYGFKIPDYLLIAVFVILLLTSNIPLLINAIKKRSEPKKEYPTY